MLSYRHGFHAGNFADVVKHVTLTLLIGALQKKDGGFCYLDTHAGAGGYNLRSDLAQKNSEYRNGIARVLRHKQPPPELRPYLDAVRAANGGSDDLHWYPGSPAIARHLLRPQDRMVLCELHNTEITVLRERFAGDRQVGVHHIDGYQALKAHLPPREKRGLVLIDPAFELKDEFQRFTTALAAAHERWPGGVYAGWFPLHRLGIERQVYRQLEDAGVRKLLTFELSVDTPRTTPHMYGCAMVIINPPWQLDSALEQIAPLLWQILSPEGSGGYAVRWVVPE